MTCPGCGKKVDKDEEKVMKDYGYTVCVECRRKREVIQDRAKPRAH